MSNTVASDNPNSPRISNVAGSFTDDCQSDSTLLHFVWDLYGTDCFQEFVWRLGLGGEGKMASTLPPQ